MINITRTNRDYVYFKDTIQEKRYSPLKIRGYYRADKDKFYIAFAKGEIQYFYPRALEGYYNFYVVGFVKVYTSGGITLSSTKNVAYTIQHAADDRIDIFGLPWKKNLLAAVADYKELYDEINAAETVVVRTRASSGEDNEMMSHPMHKTPEWIERYNKWKAEQE